MLIFLKLEAPPLQAVLTYNVTVMPRSTYFKGNILWEIRAVLINLLHRQVVFM